MGAIGFYFFYTIIWVITLLPFRVLYLLSDLLFILVYYFPSYRRKVVYTNIKNSFPEKTEKELRLIERKFYRHLPDLFIETFKAAHMSNKQIMKHFTFTNLEIFEKLHNEGRDIAAILGHYNNWEWLLCLPLSVKHNTVSIYKPLHNKFFDRQLNKIRTRNGMVLTPMSSIVREIINNKKNNKRSMYAFLSDQTPAGGDIRYWTTFLNQNTPVFLGAEKIALKYDMAVVFFNIQKIKRGYYNLNVELLFEHTKDLPEYAVTNAHVKRLEEIIKDKPEYWIWSHRRWKHKKQTQDD
jgi:KDO2-lipid IV(A) lauroyltransferase